MLMLKSFNFISIYLLFKCNDIHIFIITLYVYTSALISYFQ